MKLLMFHQSALRAFVISLLPGMSEADDVIQNTNEVLWKKRESFELGTNFRAWALTTARFQVMAFLQKHKSEGRAPLDDDVMVMIAEKAEDGNAEETNHQLTDLTECISHLQPKDQELVLHRYWKKSGLLEFARETGRSVGSLKTTLFRVRGSLRDCLERKSKLRGGVA